MYWESTLTIFTINSGLFLDVVMASEDVNDAYKRLEKVCFLSSVDKGIWLIKMRAGTVSSKEMKIYRNISNILLLGNVDQIERIR